MDDINYDAYKYIDEIKDELEYFRWFYDTTISIFSYDEDFKNKMAERYYRATGNLAPNLIGC